MNHVPSQLVPDLNLWTYSFNVEGTTTCGLQYETTFDHFSLFCIQLSKT
jgi:hypothetical protein